MLDILYEDDALLFINKPAGVVIQPSMKEDEPYLLKDVLQHAPGAFLMQRLDRGTTGVMFFSKLGAINAKLTRQFETKEIRKRYLALVDGELAERQTVDAPLAEKTRAMIDVVDATINKTRRLATRKATDSRGPLSSVRSSVHRLD